jgi:hypothetical protein
LLIVGDEQKPLPHRHRDANPHMQICMQPVRGKRWGIAKTWSRVWQVMQTRLEHWLAEGDHPYA